MFISESQMNLLEPVFNVLCMTRQCAIEITYNQKQILLLQ